ncbi:MAG: NAD(P)/FAD-dependent oxidoreductase [Actinomycetia bacterium]|nr:NAD(P)/FAD-dependent oxidoreductase [Actinomycetes bacterium]
MSGPVDEQGVDVIVVGLGPAGEAAAGQLAEAGLNVVGIEGGLVGGECPYWGCIPSKMMIRAANALAEVGRVDGLAGRASATPDWTPVAARIRGQATDDWDDTVAVDRLVGKGGTFVRGYARITGPGTVEANGVSYQAARGIIVATGTLAAVPPIPGLADSPFWTNHHIVEAKELPQSMIVLGGGAIGAELGQATSRFGVKVTVVEALDRLLPRNEPEAAQVLQDVFAAERIDVRVGHSATEVSYADEQFTLTLDDGSELTAEKLLVAVGRTTKLGELGIGELGLDPRSRFLSTDDRMRVVGQDGLWAVGDIAGDGLFTHLGIRQATVAAQDILGLDPEPLNLAALSAVTFTDPEVGAVGLTEAEAIEQGLSVGAVVQQVGHTARGWLHAAGNEGVIKLVVDTDRDIVVGATSVGPHGGEVLGLLSLAVHAEIPVRTLRSMIYAYPTFHKGIEDALSQLGAA